MTRCRDAGLVTSVAAMLAFATGCHSSNNNQTTTNNDGGTTTTSDGGTTTDGGTSTTTDGGTGALGTGNPTTDTASANNLATFGLPFDAVPSPDGSKVYFIAVDPASGPAIFSTSSTAASTATVLTGGGKLGAPLGIASSSDGNTLYLADPAANTSSTNDKGVIFTVPAAGGTPAELAPTLDYAPRSVAVAKVNSTDEVVFIGTDKTSGVDGVFEVTGSTVTSVIAGNNPSAVAVANDGTIYILDQAGSIAKVAAGGTTATALAGASQTLNVSFPSGMDVSQDQTALLVSGFDPATSKESISRVVIATGAVTQLALTPALTGAEPGGLHRAPSSDSYAFVDTGAGTDNSGTIYLLK
jgi:hypothetical protein